MRRFIKQNKFWFSTLVCSLKVSKSHDRSCRTNGYTKLTGKEIFGENINFNGCKIYGQGIVKIGNNFHSGEGLKILTSNHNYNGTSIPYDRTLITKDIIIEDNVWVGIDVIILGGVTIGEGAIIQAGSLVVKSIPPYAIAGGALAIPLSKRDIQRYENMKREERFM